MEENEREVCRKRAITLNLLIQVSEFHKDLDMSIYSVNLWNFPAIKLSGFGY